MNSNILTVAAVAAISFTCAQAATPTAQINQLRLDAAYTLPTSAIQRHTAPSMKAISQVATYTDEETSVVISEDFSLFAAGSIDQPDMTNIINDDQTIMRDYVHTYGWSAIEAFQAGGCCYLANGTNAVLATPVLDLTDDNGNFTITFSARTKTGTTNAYVFYGDIYGDPEGGYATINTTWKTFTLNASGGTKTTLIQFYGETEMFIDDIVIEQVAGSSEEPDMPISAPIAAAASDITATGFTANWNAVTTATAYFLNVFSYDSNNARQYFIQDKEVEGTSYTVEGLDEGTLYFYTVKATDGVDVSAESAQVCVKAPSTSVGSPVALPATEVSDAGFRANWEAADNAIFYSLSTISYYTMPISGTYTLEKEDFNGITEGTTSTPAYNQLQTLLDEYTKYPNWEAITSVMANGMIGLKNYYSISGQYSFLYTPVYAISSKAAGTAKVKISAMGVNCSSAAEIGVLVADATSGENSDWQRKTITNGTTSEYEFTFSTYNYDSFYFVITYADTNDPYGTNAILFIDDVTITREMNAGDIVARMYSADVAYGTSLYIETPGKRNGENLSYTVTAVTNGEEEYIYSDPSKEIFVGENGSVEINETDANVKVFGSVGTLNIETADAQEAEIYTIAGSLAGRFDLNHGSNTIDMKAGIYIVKIGGTAFKVIVR